MPKLSEVMAPAAGAATGQRMKLSEVQSQAMPAAEAQPTLFGMGSDFREKAPDVSVMDMLWGAAKDMFGSREGAADYLAEQAGGTVVKSAEGEPLLRLQDGTTYRLNESGIDGADVGNLAGNVAAFAIPAGWINRLNQAKNLSRGASIATQAGTAVATDTALQTAFNDGKVDPVRTAAAGFGGAAGEALAPTIARGVDYALRLVRGGASTEQAARSLAASLGIKAPTPEQMASLVRATDEIRAGADPRSILGREEFGFIYTQGQRALEPVRKNALLSQEELLRQQPGANAPFLQASQNNAQQLGQAVDDISGRLGAQPGATPAELSEVAQRRVAGQAEDLRGKIDKAYEVAGQSERAAVGTESVRTVPDRLRNALRDFDVNPQLTPAASRTLDQVRAAVAALPKDAKGVTLRALETQRRIINNNINAGANKTDRAAMTAIKREFDSWVDDAVETALVSGDDQALAAIKDARGLRAEFGRRFEGKTEADRFVTSLVEGGRTPEELLNVALGAGQVSKASGGRFIERLKTAVNDDPEVLNALRAAHFLRMTRGANGETLGPQAIVNNIARMEYTNPSVLRALYRVDEWQQVKRLATALEPLVPKGDFARTSGTGERLARMAAARVGGGLPVVGELVNALGSVRNTIRAGRLVNSPLRQEFRADPAVSATFAAGSDEAVR